MTSLRRWLDSTHGTRFELTRHFLLSFFESDLVTSPGEWMRAAAGFIGVLISVAILMLPMFVHRYGCLEQGAPSLFCPAVQDYHAQYLYLVRADTLWLIGLACCATALLTAIQWQSLFPALRDYPALASYPVSPREIFASKLTAVTLLFTTFVLAMNWVPSMLFARVVAGRWSPYAVGAQATSTFLAMTAGCVFVFFGMLALQGLLLNLLPARLFERATVYAQVILFTANVAVLPFLWSQPPAPWWPPNWFLGLWTVLLGGIDPAARYAIYAVVGAPMLAVLTYAAGYHRYQKLIIEPLGARPRKRFELPAWIMGSDPHERAMFAFIWKTLTRSRLHRLVPQVCAGLAIAWMIGSGGMKSAGAVPVVVVPLTFAAFAVVGLRYLFSIPTELRANWIFQIAESGGRVSWLRAVDRFVIGCALVPLYVCSLPAATVVFGWWRALRVNMLGLFFALLVFEFFFRDWEKAPFTCSYLPGKRQAWQLLLSAFVGLPFLGTALAAITGFSEGWVPFAAGFPLLFGGWRWMHRRRAVDWLETPLIYDDLPEPAVSTLGIGFELDLLEMQPTEAEAAPRTPFWNTIDEPERDPAPLFRLAGLAGDVRYGLRLLRKHYALSAAVVGTLALGIGMNVSVFTLLNAVALRPRVPDPGSFVRVSPIHTGSGMAQVGAVQSDEYLTYRDSSHSLRALAAWARSSVSLENDRSSGVPVMLVSCNFFAVYGADRPRLGRFFRPDECAAPGQAPVVVIAEELWRDRFGSDQRILGRSVALNDQRFTIVGVAPAHSPARINGLAAWIPYTAAPLLDLGFDPFRNPTSWLWLEGRLAPGMSRSAAGGELSAIAHSLDGAHAGRKTTLEVTDGSMLALQSIMNTGAVGKFLGYWTVLFLMLALGMVLCVTCANVMTLLLSRAVARRREIAVRLSLGAHPLRLLRMLMVEGLFMAVAAGALSLYLSYHVPAILFEFLAHAQADFPLEPDWRIFAYVFGVAIVAGCLSALAPALEALKVDLTASLKGYQSLSNDFTGSRLRTALVGLQVALSLALLVGGGMFLQGYRRMYRADPGYDTRHVLVVPLRFPSGFTREQSRSMAGDALERIAALPGVVSVARANQVPFIAARPASAKFANRGIETARTLSVQLGAPGLLDTLGIRLLRGRDFRDSDRPSIIVSEKMARDMSPGADPVGRVLEMVGGPSYDIIGVAREVNVAMTDSPIVYLFEGWDRRQAYLMVRFAGRAQAAQNAVKTAVHGARSDILVMPQTLQSRIDEALDETWRVVILMLSLGLVATALAVAGIYGVISFTMAQRTRELGIRMALGATRADIFREVLSSGSRPVLLGLFVGLWLALSLDSLIHHIFQNAAFRVDSANPEVYLASALVLSAAALAAMLIPARRGARSDPVKSLHYE